MSTNEKTDTTDEAGSADEFDTSRQAEIESLAASANRIFARQAERFAAGSVDGMMLVTVDSAGVITSEALHVPTGGYALLLIGAVQVAMHQFSANIASRTAVAHRPDEDAERAAAAVMAALPIKPPQGGLN